MLKKTITYTNFNDEEVTEDHYFHLSKAELVELEMSHQGGLAIALQKIIDAEDGKGIIDEFKNIILSSYGKKSPDGRRFIKTQELRDDFQSSEAYSTLFMELVTNTDAAVLFVNGIVPVDLSDELAKVGTKNPAVAAVPELPEEKNDPTVISRKELEAYSADEVRDVAARITSGEVVLSD